MQFTCSKSASFHQIRGREREKEREKREREKREKREKRERCMNVTRPCSVSHSRSREMLSDHLASEERQGGGGGGRGG